ncbi:MAG: lysophospholipid acyltransferase family protein [Myxococcales bacterium]|nr:lysophospholipid acyltransferase family protein [Myxococcales bacterium]
MGPANDELLTYAEPHDPRLKRVVIRGIEQLSGQSKLRRLYEHARSQTTHAPDGPKPEAFFSQALKELQVQSRYCPNQMAKIPKHGPLLLIANHPFGVVDGLALCELAIKARSDFKIMIHRALFKDPALQSFMLPVDFSGTREAARQNIAVRNEAIGYLKKGGTIAIFPGGGIATAPRMFGSATDLDWKLLPAKLIHAAKATVVPVFFPGQNSRLFQWASQLSETLRLSLVIREITNKRGRTIDMVIGDPIPYARLNPIKDRRELTNHLRTQVYALSEEAFRIRIAG